MPTTATLNAKINEVKSEIPRVTNLATTASDLVKKADYDAKMSEIEKSTFLLLIVISSWIIHMMQRQNKKKLVNESDLNVKIKTIATKE